MSEDRYLKKSKNPFADPNAYKKAAATAQEAEQAMRAAEYILDEIQRYSITPYGGATTPATPGSMRLGYLTEAFPAGLADNVFDVVDEKTTYPRVGGGDPMMSQDKARRILTEQSLRKEVATQAMNMFEHGPREYAYPQPAIHGPYRRPPSPVVATAGAVGPIAMLLDLLTTSPELNQGEQQQLDAIYGARPAPKDNSANVMHQQIQNVLRNLTIPR